jgi:zinc transport system ATP-binding protein
MRAVEVSAAHVRLDGQHVLDGVDLHIDRGEFVALLGANGSGKTTLVRALLRLVPLSAGSIALFGRPLETFRDWARIGYVPQRFGVPAGLPATVEEVVLSGRTRRAGWLRPYSRADRAAARAALEEAGLAELARTSVARLSGGQQQRVLIARALAAEPELLLLDEPVASVDLDHQDAFAHTLGALAGRGMTVLLVAHGLGALAPLVQRAVVLSKGRVVYDGPPLPEHVSHEHHHHHHPHLEAVPEPPLAEGKL